MKNLATLTALVAVVALLLVAAPQDAQARPQYLKAFAKKYEKIDAAAKEKKCNICHGVNDEGKSNKKLLSDYAMALKEALGEGKKNVKKADEIDAALDKVGKEDAGDGKTYADLLNDGKLPPPHESIKE